MPNKSKEKAWNIKRYIIEEFQVVAPTKKEALEKLLGGYPPINIIITKETAKRAPHAK